MVYSSMYHQGERVMKNLIQSKYKLLTSGKTSALSPTFNRRSGLDFSGGMHPNPLPYWYPA
ncbi:hypothetical protein SAMN05661012_04997 [Chitinophaga sancti]|uniref:Uncharacterized protein n=1 Tax=Chitinophaga sancti TaxID=1004 RepID=A0A1K1S906_9BACT|nr:hypothetical protein SAMN05661012_04997 [Chitinophaga sancti]